jgi:hypothetical protein
MNIIKVWKHIANTSMNTFPHLIIPIRPLLAEIWTCNGKWHGVPMAMAYQGGKGLKPNNFLRTKNEPTKETFKPEAVASSRLRPRSSSSYVYEDPVDTHRRLGFGITF